MADRAIEASRFRAPCRLSRARIRSLRPGGGIYHLHLRLDRRATIRIGRLGTFTFPIGRYVYTGSALGGLRQRIARHLSGEKHLHWHIDYFLKRAVIEGVGVRRTSERVECRANASVLRRRGAWVVVPGFGSSDCRCVSHLVHLGTHRGEMARGRVRGPVSARPGRTPVLARS